MHRSRFLLLASIVVLAAVVRVAPYLIANLGLADAAVFSRAFDKQVVTRAIASMGVTDADEFAAVLWNFSPITALFLFGGAYISDRRWAYIAPLAAMFVSDVGIGLLRGDMSQGLHPIIPAMYGSYLVIAWMGIQLRKIRSNLPGAGQQPEDGSRARRWQATLLYLAAVAGSGIAGEVVFFAVTNFATWVVQTGYYPHTPAGLVTCYLAGIPFFKHALISTPVFAVALFGGCALAENWFPALKPNTLEAARQSQPVATA
jgi:hypothetical protein